MREADECHYVSEDAIGPLWKGLRFRDVLTLFFGLGDEGMSKTALVPDIFKDARIPPKVSEEPTFALPAAILVPVGSEGLSRLIGFY